jgi:SAM-dependent methyltransferase
MQNLLKLLIISYFIFQSCIANALELNPFTAADDSVAQGLKMPSPDPDGRIQTMNKKGAMSPELDQISQEFVEFAAKPEMRVLEIGAGYGLACTRALELGSKDYTANDLDLRHLKLLAFNVKKANPDFLNNIHLLAGSFVDLTDVKDNYYDAILIARVLHFMNPVELEIFLQKSFKILKPGGRIYAVMLSPYVRGYASFIPEFERRIKAGEENPGYVKNLLEFADTSIIPESALKNADKPFFFFNTVTARKYFEKSGFIVEKAIEMPLAYKSKIWQLDGRENIGIVVYKPIN